MKRLPNIIREHGAFILLWIVLTALVVLPVWTQRLLPQLDTPNHLALVRGWHSYNDPSFHLAEYYDLRIRIVPYFLFYWSIHMLMYVVSIETANKVFLTGYLVCFPLAILYLSYALRRSRWLALGAFLLCFNMNWIYGFSSYLMGTAMMFLALAGLLRYLRTGASDALFLLFLGCTLAYLSHVMPWTVFGLCAIVLLVRHYRRWRLGLRAVMAMFPTIILAVTAFAEDQMEKGYMKQGDGFAGVWREFPTAIIEFPRRIMELFPGNLDYCILAVITLTAAGLLWWKGACVPEDDDREARDIPSLLWVLAVLYVMLPYAMNRPMSWWNISPRIPSMMAPLLFLLPGVRDLDLRGRLRLIFAPLLICCLILPLKLSSLYRDFSRRNLPLMELITRIPRGANTLVVMRGMMFGEHPEESSGDPATSAPCYWHFPSWPAALNGGYDGYVFDQGIPIKPKKRIKLPVVPHWGAGDSFDIHQAPDFEYFIIHNPIPRFDEEPAIEIVDRIDTWALYKRIHTISKEQP
jgi:hypothetical protein